MLPNRKNLLKKSLNTAASGIKRPAQQVPVGAKKQRLEFPKQGAAPTSGSSTSATTSSSALSKIVELDTSWQNSIKDMEIDAKDFRLMLEANRSQGKIPKAFCIAIKLLLKADEAGLDVELFKEILKSLAKEEDAKKSHAVLSAVFALLNKFETHASTLNLSVIPAALEVLRSVETWPFILLNYVLYDSLGARQWVDKEEATAIQLAAFSVFGEVAIPHEDMLQSTTDIAFFIKDVPREPPKYSLTPEQKTVLFKTTQEYIEKAIDSGSSKPLLRTLCFLCADEHFRLMATQKLDIWLTNTKYQRHATELLLFIATNTRSISSNMDLEVLSSLSKLRLHKNRSFQTVLQIAIKEITTNCPESLPVLTEFIVENDLTSSSKAPNNIGFLQFLYTQKSEVLKLVTMRLVRRLENSDQLKQVRLFLKEFYRALPGSQFCPIGTALFEALKSYTGPNPMGVFRNCQDLFCMIPFLAISNTIRDAAQVRRTSGNLSSLQSSMLDRFQQHLQRFTLEAVSAIKWAMQNFRVDPSALVESLYGILYLKPYQFYSSIDNWPSEVDFNNAVRIISECTLDEKLILTLIDMRSDRISSGDVVMLLKHLTTQAIQGGIDLDSNRGGICVRSADTIKKLFDLCLVNQRKHFAEAKLTDRNLYWSCWELVFCWSCMNSTLLKSLYPLYPTLRMLFSMAISSDFNFPPQCFDDLTADQLLNLNEEERTAELDAIRRANHDTNENSSNERVKPFCFVKPTGPVRQPPPDFLLRFKQLNDQFPFGINLCQVNEPDILSRVCADLGPQRVLSTVIAYLAAKPSQLETVPLICICQLYLVGICLQNSLSIETLVHSTTIAKGTVLELQDQISRIMKDYVRKEGTKSAETEKSRTVVEYLVRKLGASLSDERDAARVGLNRILTTANSSDDFDPNLLKDIAHFEEFKENLCCLLTTACTVEKRSLLITEYLEFIVENISENTMHRIAPRLSVIVERSASSSDEHRAIRQNLMKFFADFMRKHIENAKSATTPSPITSPSSDIHNDMLSIKLTYPRTTQIEIDADIVKAIMELLCESFGDYESSSPEYRAREYLMNVWFPSSKKLHATSTLDPSSSVDILPEELRNRMLSAKDERIVKVALCDVTPEEALQYIQTFALSTFSCTELLKILNQSSIANSQSARAAIPFLRAYRNCRGADQFLNSIQTSSCQDIKMEVDQSGPALFVPIERPSFYDEEEDQQANESIEEEEAEEGQIEDVMAFDDPASVKQFLEKLLSDEDSKLPIYTLTTNWNHFLDAIRTKPETTRVTAKFVQGHLLEMSNERATVLYSLLSCLFGQSDLAVQQALSSLADQIRSVLSGNASILALLTPLVHSQYAPQTVNDLAMDVDLRPDVEIIDENKENNDGVEAEEETNPDLQMHWKIAEYFEAVMLPSPGTKQLVRKLRQELVEHIKREPVVFSRQLPLLFSHVQTLLKLNTRQANEVDSYSALLNVIDLVSMTGQQVFLHTQAFETFIEIFLNSIAAHSSRSRQWESIMERLTTVMRAYLNWSPTQTANMVSRNKSVFHGIYKLYGDLLSLRRFVEEFPQILGFNRC